MPEYILLLHETPGTFHGLSPAEMQTAIQRYKGWRESMSAKGHQAGGKKLREGAGRVMKSNSGKTIVTDGPYTELREVIGGFFTFVADNFDQAVELTRDCPHLQYGTVEILEVEYS
jgi:hypothetical protein